MNLLQIRTKATDLSGRYDLADQTTYVDNGMNWFIHGAQRWLDRRYAGRRLEGRMFFTLDVGKNTIASPYIRVVNEVWYADLEERVRLEKMPLSWLLEQYPETNNELDSGTPLYFGIELTTLVPPTRLLTADKATFRVHDATVVGAPVNSHFDLSYGDVAVRIFPPGDAEYTYEIKGLFYSQFLYNTSGVADDTATSYWSVRHPDVLVMATLRQIEIFHRNTQGVNDWEKAIESALRPLELDDLQDEIVDINQMEG